jgi:hypothetical protein
MAIDGAYDVILDASVGRQKATLELRTRGEKLSGTLMGTMNLKFDDGVVSGNKLSWTMDGQIAKIYPEVVTWACTATVDGDTIVGYAKLGALGDAHFKGTRRGKGSVSETLLPWTDLGLPRYEPISVEWVAAMGAYMKRKAATKNIDFELTWSIEYTDPPTHLLRGHGPNMIGYHMVFKDGTVQVFDGRAPDADVRFIYPYDPFALRLRMRSDEYMAWVEAEGAKYHGLVKTTGDLTKMPLINSIVAGPGNDIREEFLSQQSV